MTAVDVAAGGALAGRRAVFRSCPFTGLKVDLAAQRLIAANAFAGQDVLIHDPNVFQLRLAQRQKMDVPLPFAL